jgi:hypothetical protein
VRQCTHGGAGVEQDALPGHDHGRRPAGNRVLLLKRFPGALPQRRFRVRAQRHGAAVGAGQPALPVQQRQINPDLVERTIRRGHDALLRAGIPDPKIGVCDINPHPGEKRAVIKTR